MQSREGQKVPDVDFQVTEGGQWKTVTTDDVFAGKTVVVFSLPGAFTPTCSTAHVPRYNELAPVFHKHGVDQVVCVSVNDTFVMNAWREEQKADRILFLPDGNAEFTDKMGMLVDKRQLGFGKRSWRYSMLVRDKVIEKMFIEPEREGDPYEVSDADTMLAWLAPNEGKTPDVVLFTKPGCGHCSRARTALEEAGVEYEEVPASPRMLRALSEHPTTPRVFVDGSLVGGAEELTQWLKRR